MPLVIFPGAIGHMRIYQISGSSGEFEKRKQKIGILVKHVLIRMSLPAWLSNFPLHLSILLMILFIRGCKPPSPVCDNVKEY
jgi:hypothetical protein